MTTQAPPPRSQSQLSLPNQTFFSWLRSHTTLFIGQMIGLLSVLSVPIALVYYSIHALPDHFELWQKVEKVGDFVIYAHLLFLFVFIAVLVRGLDRNNTGSYRAKLVHQKLKGEAANLKKSERFSIQQVGKFKRHFLRFWCVMLCLYFVFAIQSIFSVAPDDSLKALHFKEMFRIEFFPLLSFALNNVSLIFVFCCFSILYLPMGVSPRDPADPVSTPVEGDAIPTPEVRSRGKWVRFRGLRRRIVQRLSSEPLDELKLRQRTMVWSFIVVIVALTLTFPLIMLTKIGVRTNWSEYPAVFDALSGTINTIVLALLIARLDSKLIGLPSWLICILYFYAGVQPMFVVFELHPEVYAGIKTAVLVVVFIFKIYFFLIIFYTLQTGRLFNYFFCSEVLNEHVKALDESLPPESKLATSADGKPESPKDLLTPKSVPETEQSPPGRTVREDQRVVWFKRLGVAAIVVFTISLLSYVSLSEDQKDWIDRSSGLSKDVVVLHFILLLIICFVVLRAWRKETKSGSLPIDESRFRMIAELRFKLSEPVSPEVKELKFQDLSRLIKRQFQAFTYYFRLFWVSLALLYLAMLFSLPKEPAANKSSTEVRDEQVKLISRGLPVSPSSGVRVAERRLHIYEMPSNVNYSFVFFVLNNLTVLILFLCFAVLYIRADDARFEERRRLLRNYSLLIFVMLTLLVPLLAIIIKANGFTQAEIGKIPTVLGAVGGTLNAVAFALLIARLDSRIIRLPLRLITVLYAYAALQPLFVTFNQQSNLLRFVATAAMIAAFTFKICLVLMVGHLRRSGRLMDYLWFFPVVHKCVNSVFENQFEIKAYSPRPRLFTFSIFNKNVEVYKAAEIFKSRAKCDEAITVLVGAMKQRENYSQQPEELRELQGTHWIQVKSGTHLICESRGLRSQNEVDELIDESIEKVPYCKYDRG